MLTNLRTWFCRSVMTLLLMLPITLGWADGYIQYRITSNSNWSDAKLTYNGTVGTVDITLDAKQTYEFRFKDTGTDNKSNNLYGFSGNTEVVTNGTFYALSANGSNGRIPNATGGTYTFTVKWEEGKPSISITYSTSVPVNLPSSLTFCSNRTGWNPGKSMTMEDNGKKWSYTIDFTSGNIPSDVWFRFIDTQDANHSIISKNNGDEVQVNGDAIEGEMKGSDDNHNFMFIPSGYSKYTITAEYIESKWMVSVKSVSGSEIPEPTVDTYYLIIPNANVGNTRRAVPASEGIAPAGHTAFKFTQTRKRNSTTLMEDLTTINLKIDGDKGQQLRYDSNGEIRFYIKAGTTAYRPTSGDDELTFATNTSTNGVDAYVSRTQFASNNNHYYKISRNTVGESTKSVTFMFSKNNESNGNTIGGSNGNANSRPSVSGNLIVGFMQTRGYGSAYYNAHIKAGGVYLIGAMGGNYTSDKSYPMTKIVYPAGTTDESKADSIVYVREVKKGENTWDNFFLSFSTGDVLNNNDTHWNLLLRPNVQNQMDGQALEGGVFFFANDQATDNQQQALNPLLSEAQKQRYVSYKVYFNATYSTYRIEFYDNFYIAGPAVHGVANTAVNSGEYFNPAHRLAMRTEEVHGVTHYVYTGEFTNGSTFAFFVNPETYANNYSEDDDSQNVTNNTGDMWTTQAPTGGGEDGKDKDYPFYNHVRWNTNGDNDTGSLGTKNNGIKWTLPTGTYTLRFYNHAEKSGNNQLYTIDKVVTLKNATSVFAETEGGDAVVHNYGGWRTFSDDCALWLPNGIKAYYASEITDGKVQLTEVEDGMIPAHTGVLIYDGNLLAGSEDIHLYPVPTDYTTPLGRPNLFVDCYDKDYTISYHPQDGKYNYFFTCFYKKLGDFSKSNVPMNFWKTRDKEAKAKKNYTYLQVSTDINPVAFNSNTKNYEPEPSATNVANNARDYCFLFSLDDLDDPLITGITAPAVENSMETKAEGWYTMQGVKIQKPAKAGMYILNGRKVIVR